MTEPTPEPATDEIRFGFVFTGDAEVTKAADIARQAEEAEKENDQ